jgi:hypothetical protein
MAAISLLIACNSVWDFLLTKYFEPSCPYVPFKLASKDSQVGVAPYRSLSKFKLTSVQNARSRPKALRCRPRARCPRRTQRSRARSGRGSQVRTRLAAGGNRIRTFGPAAAKGAAGRYQSGHRHDKRSHLR